ncbi:MAG: lipid-A-disaccharide synthase [Deltaproteobacteria bacterium]|nr:lipid-A-disaccharide synthase [Deltaproteobacteria bacterium]
MKTAPKGPGKTILIIAGEASGDLHGGNLVREMRSLDPELRFYGVGGQTMRSAGVDLIADISDMAVVGITEVLGKLNRIYGVFRKLRESLVRSRPALVILIDYPDFNLLFARAAHKKGIPVVYYISPQIWAWRKGRIRTIKRLVKKMLVIFPFEKTFYQRAHVDVEFVGHPLLDSVDPRMSRKAACEQFSLDPDATTIGLLPGSRMSEIRRHLPPLLKAIPLIARQIHPVQFILPVAPGLNRKEIEAMVEHRDTTIRIVDNAIYEAMQFADTLLVASGTATVEAAIVGTPMVVLYRVSPLTYLLGKFLIKIKNIGMVNIIAGKTVVPELVQKDVNPETIAGTVVRIIESPSLRADMKKELASVRRKLGDPGASRRAARIIANLCSR